VTELVKAIACATGWFPSPVSSKAYLYTPPAAKPFFLLAGNTSGNPFTTRQTLTITDTTPGATIYYTYTTNGATPGTSVGGSTQKYNPATGITINHTGLVEALAIAPGYSVSIVGSKQYYFKGIAGVPTIAPGSGPAIAAGTNQQITLSDTSMNGVSGFAIYFTTDGSTPGTIAGGSTRLYTGPFNITSATAGGVTIKAIATAPSYQASGVASMTYTFETQLARPFFLLGGGHVTTGSVLKFTAITQPGVTILYTTDGSMPASFSTTTHTYNAATGIVINNTETVTAIAVGSGYINSNPSSKTYLIP